MKRRRPLNEVIFVDDLYYAYLIVFAIFEICTYFIMRGLVWTDETDAEYDNEKKDDYVTNQANPDDGAPQESWKDKKKREEEEEKKNKRRKSIF